MTRQGKEKSAEADGNTTSTVKFSKSFKRIRGLLTGKSRRERNKTRRAARPECAPNTDVAAATSDAPDDASTVFGVDVDERSVATGASECTVGTLSKATTVSRSRVVILVMDPETRRFELMQLEFGSSKAYVSDVLAQIPCSVSQEVLQEQAYTGVVGRDGKEMLPSSLLATFSDDVLVAIPSGVDANECVRLSRTILSDKKVADMVRSLSQCFSHSIICH